MEAAIVVQIIRQKELFSERRNMKKVLIYVLTACMLFALVGCGKKEEPDLSVLPSHETSQPNTKEESSKEESSVQETSKEESSEESSEEAPAAVETNFDTDWWSCFIPDDMHINEDYSYQYSSYSNYYIENEDDSLEVNVYITTEDSIGYRKGILSDGFTLEDYAAGNVPTTTIGGMTFTVYEYTYWGSPKVTYRSRVESSGMSVRVEVEGDQNNESIQTIMNSLTFAIPTGDKVEAPYPWEGAPLVTATGSKMMGTLTISATQLIANESFLADDIFDNRVAVVGDLVYVLDSEILNVYKLEGTALTLQTSYELEKDYANMNADAQGLVYLTDFMDDTLVYKDGALYATYSSLSDYAYIAPNGEDAITWFMDPEKMEIYTFDGVNWTSQGTTDFCVNEVKSVNEVVVTENYIMVAGSALDESGHKVFVYDYDGNLKATLADDDGSGLGSITGLIETDTYFMGIDGNMRNIVLWTLDGTWMGEIYARDILGTGYPWINGMCQTPDGRVFISLTDERADGSWDEVGIYEITVK